MFGASPHESSRFDQDLFCSMSLSLSTALRMRTSANSNCNSKENMFLFIVKCKASSVWTFSVDKCWIKMVVKRNRRRLFTNISRSKTQPTNDL